MPPSPQNKDCPSTPKRRGISPALLSPLKSRPRLQADGSPVSILLTAKKNARSYDISGENGETENQSTTTGEYIQDGDLSRACARDTNIGSPSFARNDKRIKFSIFNGTRIIPPRQAIYRRWLIESGLDPDLSFSSSSSSISSNSSMSELHNLQSLQSTQTMRSSPATCEQYDVDEKKKILNSTTSTQTLQLSQPSTPSHSTTNPASQSTPSSQPTRLVSIRERSSMRPTTPQSQSQSQQPNQLDQPHLVSEQTERRSNNAFYSPFLPNPQQQQQLQPISQPQYSRSSSSAQPQSISSSTTRPSYSSYVDDKETAHLARRPMATPMIVPRSSLTQNTASKSSVSSMSGKSGFSNRSSQPVISSTRNSLTGASMSSNHTHSSHGAPVFGAERNVRSSMTNMNANISNQASSPLSSSQSNNMVKKPINSIMSRSNPTSRGYSRKSIDTHQLGHQNSVNTHGETNTHMSMNTSMNSSSSGRVRDSSNIEDRQHSQRSRSITVDDQSNQDNIMADNDELNRSFSEISIA